MLHALRSTNESTERVGTDRAGHGASGGIGVDLAECFARDGYDLILTARSEDALNAVATRLANGFGVKATAIANDLGAIGGGKSLAEKIKGHGFTVDALVNNAGFGHAGALTAAPVETTFGMIDLNVRALVELTHIYWDEMLKRGRGGVLNVASTAAFQPGPLNAPISSGTRTSPSESSSHDAEAFERGAFALRAAAAQLGAEVSIKQDAPGSRRY